MNRREFVKKGMVGLAAAAAAHRRQPAARAGDSAAPTKPDKTGTEPRISGSFFDLIHVNWFDAAYWTDTCLHWGEASWRALIRDMHGIGIDTVICVSTAFWGRPLFPGYEKTVGLPIKFGCEDPLGACVDEADRLGMKVFLGAGVRGRVSQVRDYTRMQPPWPDVWFRWNTALAEALVDRFGKRKCFAGLYIPYEIDFNHEVHQIELYEKLIKKHFRPALGDVKLLASPGSLGTHPKIDELPKQVERTGINILAPQDYGGRAWKIDDAMRLVRANARALKQVGKSLREAGVTVWSNCELFNLKGDPSGAPVHGQALPRLCRLLEEAIPGQIQDMMSGRRTLAVLVPV